MSRRSLHYHLHQWSPRISHLCICPSPSTHCSSVTNCKQKYFTLFNPKANKKWATLDLDSDRCHWIHNHNGGLGLEIMMVLKIGKLWWFWQFRNWFFLFWQAQWLLEAVSGRDHNFHLTGESFICYNYYDDKVYHHNNSNSESRVTNGTIPNALQW